MILITSTIRLNLHLNSNCIESVMITKYVKFYKDDSNE